MRSIPRLVFSLAFSVLLALSAACSIYRPNIAQGNYVSKSQVDQLQTGMTPEQVRFVMGSPLLVDPFRPERWEYVYWFENARDGSRIVRSVTILFEANKLAKVQATDLPKADDGTDPALPKINPATLTK